MAFPLSPERGPLDHVCSVATHVSACVALWEEPYPLFVAGGLMVRNSVASLSVAGMRVPSPGNPLPTLLGKR